MTYSDVGVMVDCIYVLNGNLSVRMQDVSSVSRAARFYPDFVRGVIVWSGHVLRRLIASRDVVKGLEGTHVDLSG